MPASRLLAALIVAAALTACGGHPVRQVNPLHVLHNMMSHHLLTVNVGAVRGSGQWGSASASDKKHGVILLLDVHGAPKGSHEQAYLAKGNCSTPSRTPWKTLKPLNGGKSTTFIPDFGIGTLRAHKHSVVVAGPGGTPVACGDFET